MSTSTRTTMLAAGLTAALAAWSCGKAPEPEFIPTTNAEHNQMLQILGFSTNLGPRLDPAKREVPDGYHPLGSRYAAFHPRAELYLAGITIDGAREHLYDDASKGYEPVTFDRKQDDSWAGATLKNAVAGDFDGDGVDEIFVVYYADVTQRLRFLMLDVDGKTITEGELGTAPSTNLDVLLQPSLAAGDLDGDGRDEVAVGFAGFYLVDQLEGEPRVTSRTHDDQDQDDVFVAMGNIDWDGADELVVTYTATREGRRLGWYAIYDGSFDTPAVNAPISLFAGAVPHNAREAMVAIGDVDADRTGEIIFGGLVDQTNVWGIFLLEYQGPDHTPLYGWKSYWQSGWSIAAIPRPLLTLDWDGDGIKEIFFGQHLYEVDGAGQLTQVSIGFGDIIRRVAAGDVDGDGRDDLVFEWGAIYAYGLNSLDQPAHKKSWSGTLTPYSSAIIVTANVDHDTAMVRYDGEHELLFSPPQLVAVLASPPYHEGVGQNVDATASTFGKMVGKTVEKSSSLGVKTGFTVGYEADFAFFGSAEMELTVEQSLDFISGSSSTIETYHAFTTGPGEDKVVFITMPYDVYYYTIVSSPDPADVGRTVTINVPRDMQTLSATPDFYNSHNGGGLDVDARIFQHRVGDVWSYPTPLARDNLLAAAEARERGYQRLWNGPHSIGEGGGYSTVGINSTQGSSRGAAMDFSVELAFSSTSPGGAKAGTSVGFHYGQSFTFSTDDTAFFEGTVGNLPAEAYTAANRYQFGLFVYPEAVGGQKFLVMNYWTQQ